MKVYLSSTLDDLRDERQAVKDALGGQCTVVESYTADGRSVRESCVDDVARCDLYIGVIGLRYGFVPPGDKLSITHQEYEKARERRIRALIFLKEEGSIRFTDTDAHTQENDAGKLIKAFRGQLSCGAAGAPRPARFKTAEDLKAEVLKALAAIKEVYELIWAVAQPIRLCIKQVQLLADCKVIHDCLHDLRYKVIRRLRQELLPRWQQEGNLDHSKEEFISGRVMDANKILGMLARAHEDLLRDIAAASAGFDVAETKPEKEDLLDRVKKLVSLPPLWDPEAEVKPKVEPFSEMLDEFSDCTNAAFTAADDAMHADVQALDILDENLRQHISAAIGRLALSDSAEREVSDNLNKLDKNKTQFAAALKLHHDWQHIQDALDGLYYFEGIRREFSRHLDRFLRDHLPKLRLLIEDERKTGGEDLSNPAQGGLAPQAVSVDVVVVKERKDLCESLLELETALNALNDSRDAESLGAMRQRFDSAFYMINKRTLDVVERSRKDVGEINTMLDRLPTLHRWAA